MKRNCKNLYTNSVPLWITIKNTLEIAFIGLKRALLAANNLMHNNIQRRSVNEIHFFAFSCCNPTLIEVLLLLFTTISANGDLDMSGIVSVSEAASIAFHTAFYLASSGKQLVRNQELADELHVSQEHLAKIIQRMARAGVVKTVRGPKGGCCLTEQGKASSLLQIYEAVEGPYNKLGCLLQQKICSDECCLLGGLLQKMSNEIYRQLKTTTLADMTTASKKLLKEAK